MRAMRTVPLVAGAVIGGAVVGSLLYFGNLIDIHVDVRWAPKGSAQQPASGALPKTPRSTDRSGSSPSSMPAVDDQGFVASPSTPRQLIESATKRASAGELREAQELYLQVLLINPDDQAAMQGLVRVRRLMAGNDARALRRQAATYRRALTQGKETGEHYTAVAMDLLAVASLQAAAELEDSPAKVRPAVPKRKAPVPKPSPTASKPEAPRPKPQLTSSRPQSKPREVVRRGEARSKVPGPAPVAPKPVQKPPSAPPPPAPLTVESESPVDMNEPFVTITIGPIASRTQASNIATDLTVAGYVARMRWSGAEYQITLGPYRRSIAEKIASRIRSRVRQGIPVSLNPSTN